MSVKMGTDILVGRAILSVSSALLVLPFVPFVPLPDAETWQALAITLPAHFFYQMCLVRAMSRGDLSLVFPVMRGAAPLLTAFTALLFLKEALAPLAWIGLFVATAAVITFALPPQGVRMRDHPDKAALGWALATAVGIALYNVADARGVRIAPDPLTFIVWLFLLDPIGVTTTALLRRRNALAEAVAMKWRYGVAASALSLLSFGSALYAFSLMETAKVSALRETSVVFGALMGSLFLGESFGRRRLIAALILAAGLIIMQFGG
ncbi:MAG TPA: DMT family transporter [Allosphingosinicella sp.]|uniref:DMT family transporter n=1 Tax=Allosphingosinicella sp. TaxID=2823234 RepID=UPI002ED8AC3C